MSTIKMLVKRHPVPTSFALAFAMSWGGAFVVLGPGLFLGTKAFSFVGQVRSCIWYSSQAPA